MKTKHSPIKSSYSADISADSIRSVQDGPASRFLLWFLLLVVTLVVHGGSLFADPFLDDHWHQFQLRSLGWSPADLLDVTTIETDRFIDVWWQEGPVRWRYTRPVSVLLMKVVHTVTGGSIMAHHAVSLLLHVALACMVLELCFLLTRQSGWSLVGGLLFVVYSHSVFAVQWLAAQNAVLQAALMTAALLVYIRGSGLDVGPARGDPVAGSGAGLVEPSRSCGASMALAAVLFALALFSRPNALMFPVIVVSFDLAYGGWSRVRAQRGVHLVFLGIAVAYGLWRFVLVYEPIPAVYMRSGGDGYVLWCVAKLLHYLTCSVWLSPMTIGPTGRLHPFREVPGDCLLMIAILSVMALGYYCASRRARGYWIWPLWIVLSVLPVVPVLATPHSGYLPGVGFAVALVLGPGLGQAAIPFGIGRFRRAVAVFFLVAMSCYVPIYQRLWNGMVAAEHYTLSELAQDDPPAGVSDLFFINLPFVNIYVQPCLAEVWGDSMAGVRSHVLTFAPDLLLMDGSCTLTQLDAHSFSLSVAEKPYFSGLLGRFLLEGMRQSGRLKEGMEITTDHFVARIIRVDAEGVRELRFTFHRPLASEAYRFYLTTRERGAIRLSFADSPRLNGCGERVEVAGDRLYNVADVADRLGEGESGAGAELLTCVETAEEIAAGACWNAFRRTAAPIARATGASVLEVLDGVDPPHDVDAVRSWWCRRVDDGLLARAGRGNADGARLLRTRAGLFDVRAVTSKVIEIDLYTTGSPFPGPYHVASD